MIISMVATMLLSSVPGWGIALIAIATAAVGVVGGFFGYKMFVGKKFKSAKAEAERIVEEGKVEAKTLRKEALLEAKEEQHRLRAEIEKESRAARQENQRTEQRLAARDDQLNTKEEVLDKKAQELDNTRAKLAETERNLETKREQLDVREGQIESELERVAGMTKDEAKAELVAGMVEEAKRDALNECKAIEAQAKEEAEKKAKEIITLAIQRCATDHASEMAVSVVALPNEEMKGRIIGRVGRNIRALENATGVDIIIDDTPDVVTLSGFDPVRREIARVSLEKLVADGRIHPARIEEVVDKSRNEIENQMKEAGEQATYDSGVYNLHPELIKLLGRLKFRTSYGQNVLQHSLEVCYLSGVLAAELGADIKIAKRAGLLHDIGKAIDHEVEGTHVALGVELTKKFKESPAVVHAIEAHHGDVEPKTLEAMIVQIADAISSARPGARRASLESYVKRLESIEHIANSFDGVEQSYAIQAGREIRVMVKPEQVNDEKTYFMAKEIAKKLEIELEYPGQIKVCVIRELRSVEYAK